MRKTDGPRRIPRRTQRMRAHVTDRCCLASRTGGRGRRWRSRIPRRRTAFETEANGLGDSQIARSERAGSPDGPAGAVIAR